MSFTCHHVDKWASANVDLAEEILETQKKAIIFICGASSSGKSYCGEMLQRYLANTGHHSVTISLDAYNFGLSGIIPNKVNQHYFDSSLPHMEEIILRIRKIITKIDFEHKYDEKALKIIGPSIADLFSEGQLPLFLKGLNEEWKKLNFDEPGVYDMASAAEDVRTLFFDGSIETKQYSKIISERVPTGHYINGKSYDVIVVEGIYALDPRLIHQFEDIKIITNFIDGNPKSLFLRRIIRDSQITSAPTPFTIRIYFRYIIDSYLRDILPCKEKADVILNNDMTFGEMHSGDLHKYRYELKTENKEAVDEIIHHSEILQRSLIKDTFFTVKEEKNMEENILRLRCYSDDGGVTYLPSSLVHKGIPKVRKDGTNIRPINIFIHEGEFSSIWVSEEECLRDFTHAGFFIGPIVKKERYKLNYQGHQLVIKITEDGIYNIEFDTTADAEFIRQIRQLVNK